MLRASWWNKTSVLIVTSIVAVAGLYGCASNTGSNNTVKSSGDDNVAPVALVDGSAEKTFEKAWDYLSEKSGKPADPQLFFAYTKLAAENGQVDAMNNLAAIYANGLSIATGDSIGAQHADWDEAMRWYGKLAQLKEKNYQEIGHRNRGFLLHKKFKQTHEVALIDKAIEEYKAGYDGSDQNLLTIAAMCDSPNHINEGKKLVAKIPADVMKNYGAMIANCQ